MNKSDAHFVLRRLGGQCPDNVHGGLLLLRIFDHFPSDGFHALHE